MCLEDCWIPLSTTLPIIMEFIILGYSVDSCTERRVCHVLVYDTTLEASSYSTSDKRSELESSSLETTLILKQTGSLWSTRSNCGAWFGAWNDLHLRCQGALYIDAILAERSQVVWWWVLFAWLSSTLLIYVANQVPVPLVLSVAFWG